MTDNRDKEIVRLAVELATDVAGEAKVRHDDKVAKAKRLLALASPPKPKRHPCIDAEPSTVHDELRRGLLVLCDNGECHIRGPVRKSSAEAVAAWNEMIDRITGADEETVRLVQDCRQILATYSYKSTIQRIDRWLAERTGGA